MRSVPVSPEQAGRVLRGLSPGGTRQHQAGLFAGCACPGREGSCGAGVQRVRFPFCLLFVFPYKPAGAPGTALVARTAPLLRVVLWEGGTCTWVSLCSCPRDPTCRGYGPTCRTCVVRLGLLRGGSALQCHGVLPHAGTRRSDRSLHAMDAPQGEEGSEQEEESHRAQRATSLRTPVGRSLGARS